MPWKHIIGAAIVLPLLCGLVAWVLFGAARPFGQQSIIPAMTAVMVGSVLGPVMVFIWKPRRLADWPMFLLLAQGINLFGVLSLVLLLYSATRPDKPTFALVVGVSFIAVLVVQTRLFAAGLRGTATGFDVSSRSDEPRP